MKTNLLLIACILLVCSASAQFTPGQKMIGGQFEINFSNSNATSTPGNGQKTMDLSFSPSFSCFVSPKSFNTLGLTYQYQHTHSNIDDTSYEQFGNTHTFGVYVEHIRLELLVKGFYFTYGIIGGASYGHVKSNYVAVANYNDGNLYDGYVAGRIGLLYQLNKRFLLSCRLDDLVTLSYEHRDQTTHTSTNVYKTNFNTGGLSTGLSNLSLNSLSIGLKYMLKK